MLTHHTHTCTCTQQVTVFVLHFLHKPVIAEGIDSRAVHTVTSTLYIYTYMNMHTNFVVFPVGK